MTHRMILNETSYFGEGAINHLVEEIQKRQFNKALIVTDADLVKFNVVSKVTQLLDNAKLDYAIYNAVIPNPTIDTVQQGLESFKQSNADYLIAIGGGSPQDTAKAIGIIINNPQYEDVVSLGSVAPTKTQRFQLSPSQLPLEPRLKSRLTMSSRTTNCAVNLCVLTPIVSLWLRLLTLQ